jgi:hypothetical protein
MDKENTQSDTPLDLSKTDGENLIHKSKGIYKKKVVKATRKRVSYDPKFIKMVSRLVAAGFEPNDLAFFIGVPRNTIDQWKCRYPAFKQAVEHGKTIAGSFLIDKGLKLCDGYDITEEVVKYSNESVDSDGHPISDQPVNWVPTEKKVTRRHIPPNGALIQFFLAKLIPDMFGNAELTKDTTQTTRVKDVADGIQKLAGKLSEMAGAVQEPIDADFEEAEETEDEV